MYIRYTCDTANDPIELGLSSQTDRLHPHTYFASNFQIVIRSKSMWKCTAGSQTYICIYLHFIVMQRVSLHSAWYLRCCFAGTVSHLLAAFLLVRGCINAYVVLATNCFANTEVSFGTNLGAAEIKLVKLYSICTGMGILDTFVVRFLLEFV